MPQAPAESAPADCRVIVTPDRMSVCLAPVGAEEANIPLADAVKRLREAGIEIDEALEASLATHQTATGEVHIAKSILLAKGRPPVDEVPARLRTEVLPPPPEPPETSHYRRSRIQVIRAGQAIARLVRVSPGRAGHDLFGHDVPFRKPNAVEPRVGENARLDTATGIVTAMCDGSLCFDASKVSVENLIHIKGDVDFSTANIDFEGDVLIDGGVADLFEVRGRNVTVHHAVEAAFITARQHLHVDGGIIGKDKGRCSAGADLAARFISNATIRCEGPMTVISEITQSHISCVGKLTLIRGSILGGDVCAQGGIVAHSIGSPAEIPTVADVRIDARTLDEATRRLENLDERLRQLEKTRQVAAALLQDRRCLTELQEHKAEELLRQADVRQVELARERSALAADWRQVVESHRPEIEVVHSIHAGTLVRFPGMQATIANTIPGPVKIVARRINGTSHVFVIGQSRHAQYPLASVSLPNTGAEGRLGALLREAPPAAAH